MPPIDRAALLCAGLAWTSLLAQTDHRWDHWYFGEGNGWHFVNDTVVPLLDSQIPPFHYSSASVSDPYSGELQFYCTSQMFWTADQQSQPTNFAPYFGFTEHTQAILRPGTTDQYGLLFLSDHDTATEASLWHAEVDMQLNGGLGGLLPDQNMVAYAFGHRLMAIPAITQDTIWILADEFCTGDFYAWPYTENGLGAPLLAHSAVEPFAMSGVAVMKADRSGTRVAAQTHYFQKLDLYRFDRLMGQLHDTLTIWIDGIHNYNGFEFSPGGEVLYVSVTFSQVPNINGVLQYDLSAWEYEAVNSSRLLVSDTLPEHLMGALQLGPDDRIYVGRGHQDSTNLAVIMAPAQLGSACDYRSNAIPLSPGRTVDEDVLTFPSINWPIPLTNVGQNEHADGRSALRIQPNPGSDHVEVTIPPLFRDGAALRILDARGRVQRTLSLSGAAVVQLERGDLAEGIYSLDLVGMDGQRTSGRLVFCGPP